MIGSAVFTLVFCFVGGLSGTCGHLINAPTDTVVMVDDATKLTCRSDTIAIKWSFLPFKSPGVKIDLTNASCALNSAAIGYRTETSSTGQCDLTITNAKVNMSGSYMCSDGSLEMVIAGLTILTSSLEFSRTPDVAYQPHGQKITSTCSVKYYGPMVPSILWDGIPVENSTASSKSDDTVVSILTATMTSPPSQIGPYRCYVYFEQPTIYNIPSRMFPAVTSSHCPTKVTIMPPGGVVPVNSVVTCSSDSIPKSTYEWTSYEVGGNTSRMMGENYTLTDVGSFTLTCTAYNNLTGTDDPCSKDAVAEFSVIYPLTVDVVMREEQSTVSMEPEWSANSSNKQTVFKWTTIWFSLLASYSLLASSRCNLF